MAVNSFPESSVSELEVLESLIPLASKWNSIGLMLGLSNGELDTIKADCGGAEECLKKVLQKLYDRTPHPTWEVVIAALRSPLMKESALAEKLEKQMVRLEATPPETTPQGDVTKILAENIAKINHRFGTLVRTITKRMTRRDVDVSSFRLHIFTVFGNVSICRDNVASIMEDLTRYRILKYDCCVHIEQIAKEFVDNDADLKRQIHKYKAELAGFKATTKIVEYIKVCKKEEELTDSDQSLEKNSNHYTEKYCRKLSVKLNSRVNKMSLDYIDELWKSIADACMIPHLPVLLESIKAGCVKVTWFVPTESALQIEEIITSTKIVKMFDVIRLIMNDKILYDKNSQEEFGRPLIQRRYSTEATELASPYPEQQVWHSFRADFLRVGSDGHYYQQRDYIINENFIKSGRFVTVRLAKDLTNHNLFIIKCNSNDSDSIDSIDTEAHLLSQLGPHKNIIQMYGAVLDIQKHTSLPNKIYKLMMELAEYGNLSEMIVDPDTQQPLDRDQALFYFWQVLKGVNFLHENSILHLDIKSSKILVFDGGRMLKICGFSTAVHEHGGITSSVVKTLSFTAPEICRQEMAGFYSDMWSTMCVLVEMLTGKMPWDFKTCSRSRDEQILKIGNYCNDQMECDLIPPAPCPKLDSDIIKLMRLVLMAEVQDRETATNLLKHPLITNAYAYEKHIDEVLKHDNHISGRKCRRPRMRIVFQAELNKPQRRMSSNEVECRDTGTAKGLGVFTKVDLDHSTDVWTDMEDEIANMTEERLYHFGTVKESIVSVAPCIEPYVEGKINSIDHDTVLFINHRCECRDTGTPKGFGVFTNVELDSGTDVWTEKEDEIEFSSDEIANMTEEQKGRLYHFGTVKEGIVSVAPCIKPYVEGVTDSIDHEKLDFVLFINHSCEPNLVWKDGNTLMTNRCVKAGEELTQDYGTEDFEVHAFECHCGEVNCRKYIKGQEWRKPEMQRKYGSFFQSHIIRAMERDN